MKTFLFISFIILITILVINQKKIIPKIFNRSLSLDRIIIFYFGFAFLAALLYASIDCYLINQSGNTKFLTIYNETTKTTGHIWDYFYFSIVSQLTIGYGDYSPKHPLSQFIAISQGLFGTLFIGALVYAVLNYSTKIRLDAIELFIDKNKDLSPLCVNIILSRNDSINYENVDVTLYANINNEKTSLCSKNIQSLYNNNTVSLYINLDDPNKEYIYIKDDKLYYHENYMYLSGDDVAEEIIDFDIVDLSLSFIYTKGEYFSSNIFAINAIDSFKKIISNENDTIRINI